MERRDASSGTRFCVNRAPATLPFMRLLLIRHAQSVNNAVWAETGEGANRVSDPALTPLGEAQARALADTVADGRIPRPDVLYSSLMIRAISTAAPLADALDLPIYAHPRLFEVGGIFDGHYAGPHGPGADATPLSGSPAAVLRQLTPRLVLPPEVTEDGWFPGPVETLPKAWQRAKGIVAELTRRHTGPETTVAVVTHGWFLNHLIRAFVDWPPRADGVVPVWIEHLNTGHTLMARDADLGYDLADEHARILWLNRSDHLAPDQIVFC